jgi:hypothetical protein
MSYAPVHTLFRLKSACDGLRKNVFLLVINVGGAIAGGEKQ